MFWANKWDNLVLYSSSIVKKNPIFMYKVLCYIVLVYNKMVPYPIVKESLLLERGGGKWRWYVKLSGEGEGDCGSSLTFPLPQYTPYPSLMYIYPIFCLYSICFIQVYSAQTQVKLTYFLCLCYNFLNFFYPSLFFNIVITTSTTPS